MVRITIKSWTGRTWEGVLLSSRGLKLRLAVWGSSETLEFEYRAGQWFAENGELVEMEFHPPVEDFEVDYDFAFGVEPARPEAPTWLN